MVKITRDQWTKIGSVASGILITAAAIQRLTIGINSVQGYIISIHYIILGLFLVLGEFKVDYIIKNFGLMRYVVGKGLYLIFLGTLLFDNSIGFQIVASIILIICGFVYIIGGLNTGEAK